MNKTKTLKMKLIYIVAAVAMLAMLIPSMAIPVSAAPEDLYDVTLATVDGDDDGGFESVPVEGEYTENWVGYNAIGNSVVATLVGEDGNEAAAGTVDHWAIVPADGGEFVGDPNGEDPVPSTVEVTPGQVAQISIEAHVIQDGDEVKYVATKKWAEIEETTFTPPNGTTSLSWNDTAKCVYAQESITDTVTGDFPLNPNHPVQGVILNWYLFQATTAANAALAAVLVEDEALDLIDELNDLQDTYAAKFVEFVDITDPNYQPDDVIPPYDGWLGTAIQTLTPASGACTVNFAAWDQEAVTIVVIPQYPNNLEQTVVPERTNWNFDRDETAIIPQVRWIGEKIVLERYYPGQAGSVVNFAITTNSQDARLIPFMLAPPILGLISDSKSVYTTVAENGYASAVLTCDSPEEVVVDAHLYDNPSQNSKFRAIFLKFETINLSDVSGKRDGHYAGKWIQEDEGGVKHYNPYNKYFPDPATGYDYLTGAAKETLIDPYPEDDVLTQPRNVSEDALERVQVRGWFMGTNLTDRPKAYQDAQLADRVASVSPLGELIGENWEDYDFDYTLPEGRYVLPDDWVSIAGGLKQWQRNRGQFDIMDSPSDKRVALASGGYIDIEDSYYTSGIDGPYFDNKPVGAMPVVTSPVVGPFTPGIEVMTDNGWVTAVVTSHDEYRMIKTVVPNGALDAYDAPMPPAKILYEIITDSNYPDYVSNGYFKQVAKGDVYFDKVMVRGVLTDVYTSPFYSTLIPAHWIIAALGGQQSGSYDWDSFGNDGIYDEGQFVAPGPYYFWTIFNKISDPVTYTSNVAERPTAVEVYSDNHGEAMVYLNGDWNLYPVTGGNVSQDKWRRFVGADNGIDIQANTIVGHTMVQATADYPYVRQEAEVTSNVVEKTWSWGGKVLGVDGKSFADKTKSTASKNIVAAGTIDEDTRNYGLPDDEETNVWDDRAASDKHMAFIWACDRDGLMKGMLGTEIAWTVQNAEIDVYRETAPLSDYNQITWNIIVDENGFLENTNGVAIDKYNGTSEFRAPTQYEKQLFYKNYGSDTEYNLYDDPTGNAPLNFAVAGIMVYSPTNIDITIVAHVTSEDFGYIDYSDTNGNGRFDPGEIRIYETGTVQYTINIPYAIVDPDDPENTVIVLYPLDDPIIAGDANADSEITAADITAIERIILQLDPPDINADANSNNVIDMGDVVKVIRILRGLD